MNAIYIKNHSWLVVHNVILHTEQRTCLEVILMLYSVRLGEL